MNAIPRLESQEDLLRFQLSTLIEQTQQSTGVPGICMAVSTPNATVEMASGVCSGSGREPIDVGAHFHAGCMGKLLLSVAALELAQQGSIALNAPISETVEELSGWEQGRQIALVHLLSHTAGYRSFPLTERNALGLDWDTFIGKLASSAPLFPAGTVFNYEHTGAVLAGRMLERATGQELASLLAGLCERIGVEAGVESTTASTLPRAGQHHFDMASNAYRPVERTLPARPQPAFWRPSLSNLTLSMPDLARVGRALCGATDTTFEDPLLPAPVRGLLQRSVIHLPAYLSLPGAPTEFPRGFSLGVGQYESGWQGLVAQGFGQGIALRYHPGLQISVAVGINAGRPQVLQHLVRNAGLAAAGHAHAPPPRAPSLALDAGELCGRYENGSSTSCEVSAASGKLTCVFKGESGAPGIQIEISLDDDPPTLRSNFPGTAISFFRVPGTEATVGLMSGLGAYRKSSRTVC